MNISFEGKRVVVSGAAQGIGSEIATQMAAAGADLWLCDLDTVRLDETRKACAAISTAPVQARGLDVSDRQAIQDYVCDVGAVDVLINVAGGVAGQVGKAIEDVTPESWDQVFSINSDAMFWFAQAVTPAMKASGWGRIITISSIAGLNVSLTGIQAYAATKAAQIALTRQLAHELGPHGITVNSVAPGFVRSNPATERQWESYGPQGQAALVNGIARRRTGTAKDIAPAVLFLASEFSDWTTGQTLTIDGGK